MELDENIRKAARILQNSDAILITAGAGFGVDSGLPDFRGNEGFWRAYPPIAKLGISFSQMANPQWFFRDSQLAWGFYGHRLNLYRNTTPHDGFTRLLDIGRRKKGRYFVFTSNVDGQFQKAGYSGERIEECHGSIHHLQCARPCCNDIWDADGITVKVDEETFRAKEPLPVCRNCNELARPNVLMFGDWSWVPDRTEAQSRRLNEWLHIIRQKEFSLAVAEIGAGEAVPTVRHTSEHVASQLGGTLIRINPRDYRAPAGHISISLDGKEAAERIIQAME